MNWNAYSAMCITKGIENPYENEAHYNRAYGIAESEEPLVIRPKHKSSIVDHCKVVNAIRETRKKKRVEAKKPEAEVPQQKKVKEPKEPKPRYRPQKRYTEEEIKQRRKDARRKKRAENIRKGLRHDGKPKQPKPAPKTPEQKRADRSAWMRNYRANQKSQSPANGSSISSRELMSEVA